MVCHLLPQQAFKKPRKSQSLWRTELLDGWVNFNGSGDYFFLPSCKEVDKERGKVDKSALNSVLLAAKIASDT